MSTQLDELFGTAADAHDVRRGLPEHPRLDFSVQVNSVVAPFASLSLRPSAAPGMPVLGQQTQTDPQFEMLGQLSSARRITLVDADLFEQWTAPFQKVAEEAHRQLRAIMSEFGPSPAGVTPRQPYVVMLGPHVSGGFAASTVSPIPREKLEFSPDAIAILKSAGVLDDAKSLAVDLNRIVPDAMRVAVSVVTDPEFGDQVLVFVVHTSASVAQVMDVESVAYERLIDSRTFATLPNVAITYEFLT